MASASALLEAKARLKTRAAPPTEERRHVQGHAGDFLGFLEDEAELERIRSVTGIRTEQQRVQYFLNAGIDAWYDELKDSMEKSGTDIDSITFPTSVVDFLRDEKVALYKLFKAVFGDGSGCLGNVLEEKVEQVRGILEGRAGADSNSATQFDWRPLIARLDAAVARHGGSAFVKLSTRSPKDSFLAMSGARECSKSVSVSDPSLDHNSLWVEFSERLRLQLRASNGLGALLLLATSLRVCEDLESDIMETKEAADAPGIQIIVRTFDAAVTPSTEFRGFVWGGKFTCCGQYFHQLHFPELPNLAVEIEADLRKFYDGLIRPSIPKFIQETCPCFMMDLVWKKGAEGNATVMLTEINPFDGEALGTFPASTGLFHWDSKADRKRIMGEAAGVEESGTNGHDGFELRLRAEPLITAQNLRTHPSLRNLSPLWKWTIYTGQ